MQITAKTELGASKKSKNLLKPMHLCTKDVGKALKKGDEGAVVESVKAASEVYAPVTGDVTEVNEALNDEPGLVNSDPMGKGWFFKITISDASDMDGMMDEATYKAFAEG